ncbi:adenosylcobinamide-GDP ribazoletransferase [Candidatus Chlorohelix sp.]|uniref:adenosylcobinamide-GDP ribazoletransferase n=1 Tax=Candidatus Chlorohelix sp. TaxID=3139201 RepID=UPI00303CEBC9
MLSFLVAVQFLTTLPIPLRRQASSEDVGRAVRYFPIVGLWLGVMLASLNWLLTFFLPANIVATLLVATLLALTGALHFDGFLDSCDGMFGYRTPERRLEIMRDSHVGSFAVAGGWVLLTLKYVALLNIPFDLMTPALLLAPVLGRWALVTAVVIFPYGRDSGLGVLFKQHTGKLEMALAGLGVLLFSVLTLRLFGVALVLATFVFAYLFGKYVMSKLPAGLTGDSYGAVTESSETLVWLIIGTAAGVIKSIWFL